jgi:hypothetical protein
MVMNSSLVSDIYVAIVFLVFSFISCVKLTIHAHLYLYH